MKRLNAWNFTEKAVSTTFNASKFPFYVKKIGYLSKSRISFGKEEDIHDFVILYTLSGIVEYSKLKELRYLRKDDVILSPCNALQRFSQVSREDWEYLYLVLSGSHAKYLYNIIRTKDNVFNLNPVSRGIEQFLYLLDLEYDDSYLSSFRASTAIHTLFTYLYEASFNIMQCKNMIPIQDTHVNVAINYIIQHYQEDLSIDQICAQVGFTKTYFCKVFKDITGETIHQYVNKYRINQAKNLLSYSKLSITLIAAEVGFSSAQTFSRAFKEVVRMSPGEYRRHF